MLDKIKYIKETFLFMQNYDIQLFKYLIFEITLVSVLDNNNNNNSIHLIMFLFRSSTVIIMI